MGRQTAAKPLAISARPGSFAPMSIYAIGDIHGHLDLAHAALDLIETDRAKYGLSDAPLVQIGDLVDRGPDSASVVDLFAKLTVNDPRVTCLIGNHDVYLRNFILHGQLRDGRLRPGIDWLYHRMGGRDTLRSYDVNVEANPEDILPEAQMRVPATHVEFLKNMPTHIQFGDLFCTHAGIRPGIPLNNQDPEDLYWIREGFLDSDADHGPLIIHGHTPVDQVEHHGNRLAIDTGAAYGGPLSAVVIDPDGSAALLTPSGRQAVSRHAAA